MKKHMNFMAMHSPLGVKWLTFHADRVINAVGHIINNSDFVRYGVTSWTNFQEAFSNQIYVVQAHQYIHYAFILCIHPDR